jgi:hypothetical protein
VSSLTIKYSTRLFPVMLLGVALGLAPAYAKTNYSGTWKANIEKSDFGAMPAPDSQTDVIAHSDPSVKVSVSSKGQMGDMNYDMNFSTDGKETQNNQGDMIQTTSTAKWDGDQIVIDTKGSFNGTDFTAKERWTLAEDGKTLTVDRHVTSAMGEFDMKILMDKQ